MQFQVTLLITQQSDRFCCLGSKQEPPPIAGHPKVVNLQRIHIYSPNRTNPVPTDSEVEKNVWDKLSDCKPSQESIWSIYLFSCFRPTKNIRKKTLAVDTLSLSADETPTDCLDLNGHICPFHSALAKRPARPRRCLVDSLDMSHKTLGLFFEASTLNLEPKWSPEFESWRFFSD